MCNQYAEKYQIALPKADEPCLLPETWFFILCLAPPGRLCSPPLQLLPHTKLLHFQKWFLIWHSQRYWVYTSTSICFPLSISIDCTTTNMVLSLSVILLNYSEVFPNFSLFQVSSFSQYRQLSQFKFRHNYMSQ